MTELCTFIPLVCCCCCATVEDILVVAAAKLGLMADFGASTVWEIDRAGCDRSRRRACRVVGTVRRDSARSDAMIDDEDEGSAIFYVNTGGLLLLELVGLWY